MPLHSAKLLLSCLFVFCLFVKLFVYFSIFFVLGFVCTFFLYQRADKTEQDCLAMGEKCSDIPGQRGEQGGVGEDGGYAGHSGKCERVTGVGHKCFLVTKLSCYKNIAISQRHSC